MLLLSVTSIPSNGENDSLMLTVDTLYIELGIGAPVVASLMNPSPFMYSMKVLYDEYEPTAYTLLYAWLTFTLLNTSLNQGSFESPLYLMVQLGSSLESEGNMDMPPSPILV